MAPSTVDAVVLLGWMDREAAVKYLQEECVFEPPLTDRQSDELWKRYRTAAEALPERTIVAPQQSPLSPAEQQHAVKFLSFMKQLGIKDIQSVLKINPMQLAVRQYVMITGRAEEYRARCNDLNLWMEECLPTSITSPRLNVTGSQNQLDTSFDIDIPHSEFMFGPTPNGMFAPSQCPRHVTVTNVCEGMLLWAGYHRLYAQVASRAPAAAGQSALVALASNTIVPPPKQPTRDTVVGGNVGLYLYGCRPALFSDFFTDDLIMKIRLRKKRYQLQVRSRCVAIDDID